MAFIDLFIGGFVLPMRFISSYGTSLTPKLCAALTIGESCAMAAVIYAVLMMISTRLYDLKQSKPDVRRRVLLGMLLVSWIVLFLFYGIPFMTNYDSYLLPITSSVSNLTSYCSTYATSIYHPTWMAYTEIASVYCGPLLIICLGLFFLLRQLCQPRPRRMEVGERKIYTEQRKMTWHVFLLGVTFLCLWVPWISIRILLIFSNTRTVQRSLQITYYILLLKSVLFPILYASTNTAFRGSFAIYRHQRITLNNQVWTVNEQLGHSVHRQRRGY